jgi:hypothetical protein
MDQALSLYLIETVPVLDPESEAHALDLVTRRTCGRSRSRAGRAPLRNVRSRNCGDGKGEGALGVQIL